MSLFYAIAAITVGVSATISVITVASLRFLRKRLEVEDAREREEYEQSKPNRDETLPEIDALDVQQVCPYCHAIRLQNGEHASADRVKPLFDQKKFAEARNLLWTSASTGKTCSVRSGTTSAVMLHLARGARLYQACLSCGAEWVFDPKKKDAKS